MRVMLFVIASVLVSAVGPVGAAERAWFLAENSLTQISITNQGSDWTESWRLPLPAHRPSQPIAVAGGRYIVWGAWTPEGSALVRFDTRSGVVTLFPGIAPITNVRLAIDRRSGHLVVLDWATLYVLDVANLRVISATALAEPDAEDRSLAVALGRSFVGTNGAGGVNTLVIDLDTLQPVALIPGVWFAQTSRDETRVYLQHLSVSTMLELIVDTEVRDAATLALMATPTVVTKLDIVGDLVVTKAASGRTSPVEIFVHDPDSLAVVYQTQVPVPYMPITLFELHEPGASAPIVLRTHTCMYGVCGRAMQVFDRATLTRVREFWQAPFDVLGSRLLMLARPDPPRALRATTAGNSVTVEWNAPPDVGEFELSAGTAPGLTNVGTLRTGGRTLVQFAGVPSGTYYLRVRALNELGTAQSEELQLLVP